MNFLAQVKDMAQARRNQKAKDRMGSVSEGLAVVEAGAPYDAGIVGLGGLVIEESQAVIADEFGRGSCVKFWM